MVVTNTCLPVYECFHSPTSHSKRSKIVLQAIILVAYSILFMSYESKHRVVEVLLTTRVPTWDVVANPALNREIP